MIDFMSKHLYELIEKDDIEILHATRHLSQTEDSTLKIRKKLSGKNQLLNGEISVEQAFTMFPWNT